MNKKAYYRKLVEIREEFKKPCFDYLFSVLEIFEPPKREASGYEYFDIVGTDSNANSNRSRLTNVVSIVIEADKQEVSPRKLHRNSMEIEHYIEQILSIEYIPDLVRKPLQEFFQKMDFFLDFYETYRLKFERHSAYELSVIACQLIDTRKKIEFIIDILLQSYTPSKQSEDRNSLELYLGNVPTLKNYGIKLQALDDLYTELAYLCEVPLSDFPVTVEHLENGSLLARISGHPLVVALLSSVLTSASNYCINQYLVNGKVTSLNEKIEILDNMFELTKKLEEEGYAVDDMQDGIQRSLKKLSKSSNVLLSDQAVIEVNDEVFQLDQENATKLLQETKRLEVKDFDQEA